MIYNTTNLNILVKNESNFDITVLQMRKNIVIKVPNLDKQKAALLLKAFDTDEILTEYNIQFLSKHQILAGHYSSNDIYEIYKQL